MLRVCAQAFFPGHFSAPRLSCDVTLLVHRLLRRCHTTTSISMRLRVSCALLSVIRWATHARNTRGSALRCRPGSERPSTYRNVELPHAVAALHAHLTREALDTHTMCTVLLVRRGSSQFSRTRCVMPGLASACVLHSLGLSRFACLVWSLAGACLRFTQACQATWCRMRALAGTAEGRVAKRSALRRRLCALVPCARVPHTRHCHTRRAVATLQTRSSDGVTRAAHRVATAPLLAVRGHLRASRWSVCTRPTSIAHCPALALLSMCYDAWTTHRCCTRCAPRPIRVSTARVHRLWCWHLPPRCPRRPTPRPRCRRSAC